MIQDVITCLNQNHMSVSVAESCTGGMISSTLVSFPGVSSVFNEGYITYSNDAKVKNLGVSKETLERVGAVSEETAREMATGVRSVAEADFGLATTGIAGPDGGTEEKPVGLVYIGCASRDKSTVKRYVFEGDRQAVREQACKKALELLEYIMRGEGLLCE